MVSSGDGTYRVPDLDPGRYSVTFELDTFQKVVVDDVIVLLGRTVGVDAELQAGRAHRNGERHRPTRPSSSTSRR